MKTKKTCQQLRAVDRTVIRLPLDFFSIFLEGGYEIMFDTSKIKSSAVAALIQKNKNHD